jgi:hypothetical protein
MLNSIFETESLLGRCLAVNERRLTMQFGKMALVAASAVIVGATSASAAVVCNDEGDCWRVKKRVEYRPELRLRVYEDDWKWKEGEKYRWREPHGDHGYWRSGVWIDLN